MNEKSNKCLYCETELTGRSDKRFCNASCKSAYHNQKPNSDQAYIRSINSQLRKNRSALRTACPMGKATVRKDFLLKLGMHFKYHTHTWTGRAGQIYYFCYDYGFSPVTDPNKVLIIQQQHYME